MRVLGSGTHLAVFITFPLHVSYCSMTPLLRFRASELCLILPAHSPFSSLHLRCWHAFLRHPSLIILPHISSGVLPHSVSISHPRHHRHPFFPCKLCTSIYAGSCVSRGRRECRGRFSTLYLLPVLSTSLPRPPLPSSLFSSLAPPLKWHSGYLGLVYVVGFAPCLVFILATAYPITPPDVPSTSPPFSSPGLWLQLAVSPTLLGEHLYILRRLLWFYSPCLRLRPVLRFVCAIPRCPAAAPPSPSLPTLVASSVHLSPTSST